MSLLAKLVKAIKKLVLCLSALESSIQVPQQPLSFFYFRQRQPGGVDVGTGGPQLHQRVGGRRGEAGVLPHPGCEADDRANTLAFSPKLSPFQVRFNAVFGSDIGHFDVPDMRAVLEEAYELREEELIDAEDFRDFVFANAVRLHGGMNPKFFEGTAVEREAAQVLTAT